MIINKNSKSINIVEVARFLVVSTLDVVHIFTTSKHVTDGVVHRVVEKSSEGVLIWSDIGRVSIEALAHLEDAGGFTVFGPEIGGDLRDGVDTNTIETVGLDNTLDPVLEVLANVAVALIKIGESSKTAVLDRPLVTPVDIAVIVIVVALIKRVELTEVITDRSAVVGDDVNHHPDISLMGSLDEILQVIGTTEIGVDLLPVASPVSVITTVEIIDDRRDPDGIETHTLDIVQVVDESLVVTAAVARKIITVVGAAIASGESIGEDLIDTAFLPVSGITSLNGGKHESGKSCEFVHISVDSSYKL